MELRNCTPNELAVDLLSRSTCLVQVAAVIADSRGIFSWGWNSSDPDGMGLHAEAHAIVRGNRKRFRDATMYVVGRRLKSGNTVLSKPCAECAELIESAGITRVWYREPDGIWRLDG